MAISLKQTIEPPDLLADLRAVAQTRDKLAFTRLFDHFVPMLKAFILSSHPGSSNLAAEITQEVMLKVWTKAHTYNPNLASINTWMYTLARNARIDYLRKNSRHQSDIDPEYLYHELEDENADPFTAAQQRREEVEVRMAMDALPEEQKAVIAKVFMEGKSHAEVAKEMALPLGTVKSRVRLAMKKMAIGIRARSGDMPASGR